VREPRIDQGTAARRADAPRSEAPRSDRRPRRDAAEENDRVVGFGEFMPDFMRLPRRATRTPLSETEDAAA
jgi:hypothetical protein